MKIIEKIQPHFNKLLNETRKHSPEILLVGGIVGLTTGTIMACVASTKVKDISTEHKENLAVIKSNFENKTSEADVHERKKQITKAYFQTGVKYVRLYAPSVVLWSLSMGSVVGSSKIQRERNAALAAAYATIDKGFKEYRQRVADKFGEKVDKEILYNTKDEEVESEEIDEKGKMKKTKKIVHRTGEPSIYARYFEEYTKDDAGNSIRNWNWKNDAEMNLYFLKIQQDLANNRLKARGILFLNEVYEMLGLPATKAGQIVGWVYDPAFPPEDRHVDFGIFANADDYGDFVNYNDAILLDFNVAGNVWDLMND